MMTEAEIDAHEALTAATMPLVVLFDDYYDEFGSDMAMGLLYGLIQHKNLRDMGGVPVQ
jgi:hypothetical protein